MPWQLKKQEMNKQWPSRDGKDSRQAQNLDTKRRVGYAYWRVQAAVRSRTVRQPEYRIGYSICRDHINERAKEIKSPSSPPTPMAAYYRLRSQPFRCMITSIRQPMQHARLVRRYVQKIIAELNSVSDVCELSTCNNNLYDDRTDRFGNRAQTPTVSVALSELSVPEAIGDQPPTVIMIHEPADITKVSYLANHIYSSSKLARTNIFGHTSVSKNPFPFPCSVAETILAKISSSLSTCYLFPLLGYEPNSPL